MANEVIETWDMGTEAKRWHLEPLSSSLLKWSRFSLTRFESIHHTHTLLFIFILVHLRASMGDTV